ncbi:sugar transferase [Methylobacterium sp. P5_C11]
MAASALFLLLPLLLLIAGLVFAGDRNPPIHRHVRVGRHRRRFGCLRFRSVITDGGAVLTAHLSANPQSRAEWAATNEFTDDPRITTIGEVLHRTSLDEFPNSGNCCAAR